MMRGPNKQSNLIKNVLLNLNQHSLAKFIHRHLKVIEYLNSCAAEYLKSEGECSGIECPEIKWLLYFKNLKDEDRHMCYCYTGFL